MIKTMTKVVNNKSIFLIFDAKDCTPNGDPDTGMQRVDSSGDYAVISDLRIKRYSRDNISNDKTNDIFVEYNSTRENIKEKRKQEKEDNKETDGEKKKKKKDKKSGASAKYDELKNKYPGLSPENILLKCIDVRLFGGIVTQAINPVHIMGAVQFLSESKSLNKIELKDNAITSVFPSDTINNQGSIGRDSHINYGIFCIRGNVNATAAAENNLSEEDIEKMLLSIYNEISTKSSRSKIGQTPLAFIVINHKTKKINDKCFKGYNLDYDFKPITISKLENISKRDDYDIDFSNLLNELNNNNYLENVTVYTDKNFIREKLNHNLIEIINPWQKML